MTRILALICVGLVANPVAAQTICRFETECYETEGCSDTDFSLSLESGPNGPDHIQLVTEAETLDAFAMGNAAFGHIAAISESAFHLISLSPLGLARYTVHVEGPSAITYHGSCEAK